MTKKEQIQAILDTTFSPDNVVGYYYGVVVYKGDAHPCLYNGGHYSCLYGLPNFSLACKVENALKSEEKQKARQKAMREKKAKATREKRERMTGATVNFTLSDLADLADLFDVDDTADICNHYATAYAF